MHDEDNGLNSSDADTEDENFFGAQCMDDGVVKVGDDSQTKSMLCVVITHCINDITHSGTTTHCLYM